MAKEVNKSSKDKKEKNNFFKEFKAELKRVSWPTFKQLVNNTVAVLAIVLITAVIVFGLDFIVGKLFDLNNLFVEKLKTQAIFTSSSDETSETEENTNEINVESETSNEADESNATKAQDANTLEAQETNNTEAAEDTTTENQ